MFSVLYVALRNTDTYWYDRAYHKKAVELNNGRFYDSEMVIQTEEQ